MCLDRIYVTFDYVADFFSSVFRVRESGSASNVRIRIIRPTVELGQIHRDIFGFLPFILVMFAVCRLSLN